MLIDDVKQALRVTGTALNIEIGDLIEAAKLDLSYSGIDITKTVEEDQTPEPTVEEPNPAQILVEVMDPLLKRAVILYCKANFGYDNADADRFMQSYHLLETHLALSEDYQRVVV